MPMKQVRKCLISEFRIGCRRAASVLTYVDAPVNYLADLSVKPVTYNPPLGTGVPRRDGNYRDFKVRIHNARPYVKDLSLDRQAFILTPHDTQVRDFYDEDEIRRTTTPRSKR